MELIFPPLQGEGQGGDGVTGLVPPHLNPLPPRGEEVLGLMTVNSAGSEREGQLSHNEIFARNERKKVACSNRGSKREK